jgi:acetylglutamate kinase
MTSKRDRAIVVSALKHAAPYIRLFKGKVFVIKVGGEVFADPALTNALVEQVGILHQVGIRTVLIHGGGPQSTELAKALGIDTKFVEGRRVTDSDSLSERPGQYTHSRDLSRSSDSCSWYQWRGRRTDSGP